MSESNETFRDALARFASGVVVAAAHTPEGPIGFTASAFSSLSLDPPLILLCVAKKASVYARIVQADFVGISVLHAEQRWIADQFARHGVDRFHGVPTRPDATAPLIEGAIAQLECSRHGLLDAGDHTIFTGRVRESRTAPGRPLVHYARAFGGFSAEPLDRARNGHTPTPAGGQA
jgi:flavin reductase (DIM6/NTAB) family NADH-FMN oxidoreductase RutF